MGKSKLASVPLRKALREVRSSGRTTRQADAIIQQLFVNGSAEVLDHHGTLDASNRLKCIVTKRLLEEHGIGLTAGKQYGDLSIVSKFRSRVGCDPIITLHLMKTIEIPDEDDE